MVYGFNKKSTAENLSQIERGAYAEQSTRRRVQSSIIPTDIGLRQFYGTPSDTIPAGTPTQPRKGMASIVRLDPQAEEMMRTEAVVEVWNTGPELLDNGDVTPLVRLWGDSHGRLWIIRETRITIQFPAGGLPAMSGGNANAVTPTGSYEPGFGVCKVLVLDDNGGTPTYKDTGRTETVYNWSA